MLYVRATQTQPSHTACAIWMAWMLERWEVGRSAFLVFLTLVFASLDARGPDACRGVLNAKVEMGLSALWMQDGILHERRTPFTYQRCAFAKRSLTSL